MTGTFERVSLLIDQRRYELAEQELRNILADNPDDAIAHSTLSFCQGKQAEYTAALKSAQVGAALAPDSSFAHYHLALACYWKGKYREMYQAVQAMKAIAPQDADACMLEAFYWAHKERSLLVLQTAEAGLRCNPRHAECQILRIQALIDLDRLSAAEEGAQRLCYQDPEHPQIHAIRGWIALRQGKAKTALKDFQEALRLDPDNDWAHQGLMTALRRQNPFNILHYVNPYGRLLFDSQQVQTSYWLTAAPLIALIGVGISLATQNWRFAWWIGAVFFVMYLLRWGIAAESMPRKIRGGVAAGLILGAAFAGNAAMLSQSSDFWMLSCAVGILAYLLCRRWEPMGNLEQLTCVVTGGCAAVGMMCLSIALSVGPILGFGAFGNTAAKLALTGFLTLQIAYSNSFGR